MKGVERARLEIVVARQDVQGHRQLRHGVAHEAELRRRSVIGIVPRQHGEIDASGRQALRQPDDALKVPKALPGLLGDMQIADMQPAQHPVPPQMAPPSSRAKPEKAETGCKVAFKRLRQAWALVQ